MKTIKLLTLTTLALSTSLYANDSIYYVDAKKLKEIIPVTQLVVSGPIKEEIKESIVEVKKEIVQAKPIVIEKPKEDLKPIKQEIKEKVVVQKPNYFFEFGLGGSVLSKDKEDKAGSISLAQPIDTTGFNLNTAIGYNYTNSLYSTLGFNYQQYDDIKLYNTLLSFNKRYSNFYTGLLVGTSAIELTKQHINSPLLDKNGLEFTYGLQVGYSIPIDTNLEFYMVLQYLKANHITKLESTPAQSEITRDHFSSFSVGIRW